MVGHWRKNNSVSMLKCFFMIFLAGAPLLNSTRIVVDEAHAHLSSTKASSNVSDFVGLRLHSPSLSGGLEGLKTEWADQLTESPASTLGRGATADVYKVQLKECGTFVAVKRQKTQPKFKKKLKEYLGFCKSEFSIQKLLASKYTLVAFDMASNGDSLLGSSLLGSRIFTVIFECDMVLEFADGGMLHDTLGTLPEVQVAGLVIEMLEGIAHIHRNNIIHRDIKPDNVFVSGGHAKIGDFGISKWIHEIEGISKRTLGDLDGTPEYFPPELYKFASGQSQIPWAKACSPLMDVWAAGITVFQLITGEYPKVHKDIHSKASTRQARLDALGAADKIPIYNFADQLSDSQEVPDGPDVVAIKGKSKTDGPDVVAIKGKSKRPEPIEVLSFLLANQPEERNLGAALVKAKEWYIALALGEGTQASSCWKIRE